MTPSAIPPSTRVCDRCIRRKTKCDLARPTCSRCRESGVPCAYSSSKKQPGPVKGAARKSKSKKSHHLSLDQSTPAAASSEAGNAYDYSVQPTVDGRQSFDSSLDDFLADLATPSVDQWNSMRAQQVETDSSKASNVVRSPSLANERDLLMRFIENVHPSLPLFHQDRLINRYDDGTLSGQLLATILALTEIVTKHLDSHATEKPEDRLDYLLEIHAAEEDHPTESSSLDDFQQACLLAFYAFHQHPGEKSWMRIGQLTRKAYKRGLHRIDDADRLSDINSTLSSQSSDVGEWRRVWWIIFCLDSYSNITSSTPFVVEAESIKTALMATTRSLHQSAVQSSSYESKFLPPDTSCLYKLAQNYTPGQPEHEFNMHVITVRLLREAANNRRLWQQTSSTLYRQRLKALEDDLAALRLALPAGYLKPARNVFDNEARSTHHARLICNLHLHVARMMIYTPSHPEQDTENWLSNWHDSLQTCEDIVAVTKCWDTQFCSTVDPAICFIISCAIMMLHLHRCAESTTPEIQSRTSSQINLLVLFLDQFASVWKLPLLLKDTCDGFTSLVAHPLKIDDIDRILRQGLGSLTQDCLKKLSLTSGREDSVSKMHSRSVPLEMTGSDEDWNLTNWEAVVGTPVPQQRFPMSSDS